MMAPADDAQPSRTRADARADLRVAWDEMLHELGRARDAIDNPRLYPPPPSDRNFAEGYRYLLGYIYGAIERTLTEDPDFPSFRRALQPLDKATIDNPDAIYFSAAIDGNGTYRVRAKAQDFRHWRGEPAASSGFKAPQYVIFEVASGYAGDSGSIKELAPGSRVMTGSLDSSKLMVEPDGSFEILLAPQRPDGYAGNFIPTRRSRRTQQPDGTTLEVEYTARYLTGRELFCDWEREQALDLHIARVGFEGAHPQPLDPPTAAQQMQRVGEIVKNQMLFWNEFYAVVLESYEDMDGDGKRFMPRNDLNAPNFASIRTGGGQSTNLYAGGIYELGPDEALIIEERIPVPPAYIGFQLSNLWGESLDYANCVSSLNGFQTEWDADGVLRYIIAHRDPGVPNWVDTTELPEGFMSIRWTYSDKPDQLPTIKATKVPFAAIRQHLPAGVRTVSPEERREQIRIRQEHVQRRFRQY
jgi:hypothetical protein